MSTRTPSTTDGTITFDNAFRGIDPFFEEALSYHALEAMYTNPQHLDRIAAAVAICQQGSVQLRAKNVLVRDGTMVYETVAAKVKVQAGALEAFIVTSDACLCGKANGGPGWPCVHRYAAQMYHAASRTAEQSHYEAAVA